MEKCLVVLGVFCAFVLPCVAYAQESTPIDSGSRSFRTLDSLTRHQTLLDSLAAADSMYLARELHSKQLANMRHFHLSGDSLPETLRIEGLIIPKTDDIVLHFTIKSPSGKLVWNDRWKAVGYFDPADTLSDSIKLLRLRHIIHAFFANENFTPIDSVGLIKLFEEAQPADIPVGSEAYRDLEREGGTIYNVFRSRDYFYGIVWDKATHKFERLWRN